MSTSTGVYDIVMLSLPPSLSGCRYFREPWACAVFHDRFPDLREEVMELLSQQPMEEGGVSMEQKVRELLSEQQTVSPPTEESFTYHNLLPPSLPPLSLSPSGISG